MRSIYFVIFLQIIINHLTHKRISYNLFLSIPEFPLTNSKHRGSDNLWLFNCCTPYYEIVIFNVWNSNDSMLSDFLFLVSHLNNFWALVWKSLACSDCRSWVFYEYRKDAFWLSLMQPQVIESIFDLHANPYLVMNTSCYLLQSMS